MRRGETMDAALLMVGGALDERGRPDGDPVEATSAVPVPAQRDYAAYDAEDDRVDPADPWQPPSWEQVVTEHGDRVYRLAYRLTGNKHDAEDLTQEVFVRVFRSLST